uniref:Sushi, von Willebrand factor type A, EGF and pentraxin domain containing 1 n=1 Tax=Anabas testudineus TaxID=64144 RepID=A0A7N6B1L6_ANATE
MFLQRYSLISPWTTCLVILCILDIWITAWPTAQQTKPQLQSRRSRQMSPVTSSSSAGNLSESAESKVERLGQAFKRNVRELREKSSCLDLVFLVDESSSVGANNFLSELRFVRKMLSDFPVAPENTRVALVTFSSKTHVVTRVDHISAPKSHQHKCSLFNQEIPAISYRGGGTYTKGAFQRAAQILRQSRANATKAIFLITDGYSNGGDPRPVAAALRERGVEIFTLGIWQGNIRELHDMASYPKDQHCYLVHNFAEFEALARRALHEDLPTGSYIQEDLSRCSSLCEAGKDCCDLMASCRCGTHTGQYDCICEKGYYGKGLQHECTACPTGTYKPEGTPGGLSTCLPCPDPQHTSQPGSTSLSDCVCKPGYQPVGMTCQVIYCPALSPPENGFFVQNVCNNHFDAACGVRCQPGFDIQGTSIRLCQADGTWSGSPAICRVRSCPPLSQPQHGLLRCSDGGASYRAECQVSCERGYRLEGDSRLTCQANSQWNRPQPRCVGKPSLPQTTILPCSVCLLTCLQGYSLQGNRKAVCMGSGNWTANAHKAICKDTEPPWIQCPGDVVAETDERRGAASVSWNVPNATDNSKEEIVVQVKPVYTPPQLFPIGKETITYIATDRSGNQANCSFTVTVIDTEPPVIDRCRSPPTVQATDTETAVVWEVPQFSDNSGGRLTVTSSHTPGSLFQVGDTLVQYTATDAAGNSRTCNLTITVQGTKCEQPYIPVNGEFICSEEDEGVNCTLHCKDGYSFTHDAVHSYFCANGVWVPPYSADRPDCSGKLNRIANSGFKPFEMLFKASRCEDVDLVKSFTGEACTCKHTNLKHTDFNDNVTCKLEVMSQGHCLEYNYDYENGFSIGKIYTNKCTLTECPTLILRDSNMQTRYRTKRHRKITGPTKDQKIQIFFNITASIPLPLSRNDSIEVANQKRLLRTLEQLTNRLKRTLAKQPLSSFHVSSEMIVADPKSLESKKASLFCRPGSMLKGRMCVQCPVGTYFSLEYNECESCWLGSYQDQEGQLECKSCPEGTSTAYLHSRSLILMNTKFPCSAGHFSRTGLVPCYPCPRDYYQPEHGRSYCLSCPFYGTTTVSGATTIQHCSSFGSSFLPKEESVTAAPEVEVFHECFLNPCQNKGTCEEVGAGYVCTCMPGFTGAKCEIDIDECDSAPCQNGGLCKDGMGEYQCQCKPGFLGSLCEAEVNECISSPCLNEGVCVDEVNKFTCSCASGFTGPRCEMEINECLSNPCLNGGVCEDLTGGYTCNCAVGFSGDHCEVNIDECYSTPCLNGGSCLDAINNFRCQCVEGYRGRLCEVDVDECDPNPCVNGASCLDGLGSYTCRCLPGFNGTRCETEMSSAFNLDFEVSGIHGYVMMDGVMPALTEITCTFWMRSSDTTNYGTPVSYAVEGSDNAFLLIDYNGWVLYVNGKERITDCPAVNTGHWYHIGVSWRSWDGDWRIYINGKPSDGGKGLSVGTTIPGGGALVLGQDQDQRGEGFNPVESFVGSISQLNIWDRVLTPQQVKVLASSCPASHVTHRGNVLAWPDFLNGAIGRVKVNLSSIFCADCPKLENAVPHMHTSTVEVNPGALVQLSCDPGFFLVGEPVLQCQNKGEWSHPLPSCERVSCGAPRPLENGLFHGTDFYAGSSVVYQCNVGFYLLGDAKVHCSNSGKWGGNPPACLVMYPSVCSFQVRGRLTFNSKITYACNPGYRLVGRPDRVCQANRQWSNSDPPTCVILTCDPPPDVVHGHYRGSQFQVGRKVEYICDEGYELIGDAIWTCLKYGKWDKTRRPRCSPVQCPEPPLEENHLVLKGLDSESGTVELSCEDGYILEGARILRCTPSQEWNDTFPVCKQVSCGPLPEVSFGGPVLSSVLFPFGSVVTYTCMDGFTLKKEGSVSCLASGHWSSPYPECIPVECPQPVEISNGIVDVQGLMYLSKALYSCKTGYNLVGNSTVLCGEKGLWIGGVPSCRPVECSVPKQIANGKVIYTKLQFGHSATFSCRRGYRLQGPETLMCLASGEWDVALPACVQISCTPPQPIENGFVEGQDHSFGVTIFYSCFPGFQLVGQDHLTCEEFGWSSSVPVCVPSDCGLPPHIDFGEYVRVIERGAGSATTSKDTGTFASAMDLSFLHGTMIEYRCHKGYDLTSHTRLVCQEDGGWNGTAPSCVPAECETPPNPDHGWVNVTDASFGSIVRYTCEEGYELEGEPVRECVTGRLWTNDAPICRPVCCGDPGAVDNGTTHGDAFVYPEVLHFECSPGFVLKGSDTIACQADGKWNGQKPQCEPVSCGPPQVPREITFKGEVYTYRNEIELNCQPGFILQEKSISVCQADGTWSHKSLTCVTGHCKKPSPIPNGRVLVSEFNFNSKITYECDEGYTLNGDATSVCQSDGQWDKPVPRCDIISCDPPEDISHGFLNGSSFNYDDVVEYVCFDGYEVVGDPILRCSDQGLWVGTVPHCRPCTCPLPVVKFGVVLGRDHACGDRVRFQCNDGYKLLGPLEAVCEKGGVWSPGMPVCGQGRCTAAPPTVPNAVLQGGSATFQDVVIYRCRPGYQLKGFPHLSCGRDGRWGDPRFSCEPVSCGKPPAVAHAQVTAHLSCQSDGTWSKHSIRCRPKPCQLPTTLSTATFYPSFFLFVVCHKLGGRWAPSLSTVSCELVVCEKPPPVDYGVIEGDSYNYGDFVMYSCLPGFDLKGDSIQTCQGDGSWSGTQPVLAKACESPKRMLHGKVQERHLNTGRAVEFQCDKGYDLVGDPVVVCMGGNTWSSTFPTCQPKSCPTPPGWREDSTGNRSQHAFHVGQSVRVTCPKGQQVKGSGIITCRPDQTWTPFSSVCERVSCGPPLHVTNGVVRGAVFQFGDVAVYSCFGGYAMEGVGRSRCLENGTWTPPPTCRAVCWLQCQNGGVCQRPNTCSCPEGWMGRLCEEPICILPCLNGGRCVAPYQCECPTGWTGTRCHTAVCSSPCLNGGRCIRPNRCHCSSGWGGHDCSR